MGKLSESPVEVRLAATLFLLLLGLANLFGAWQVRNFSAFTPRGVAATLKTEAPAQGPEGHAGHHTMISEQPVTAEEINAPRHRIDRELLVQDSHIHIPAYALTAAAITAIVLGLRLPTGARIALILAAFGAPFLDFAGLWGAHLFPAAGAAWATLAVVGGFSMGLVYLIVTAFTLLQCWIRKKE
jgi:hypothetical protein